MRNKVSVFISLHISLRHIVNSDIYEDRNQALESIIPMLSSKYNKGWCTIEIDPVQTEVSLLTLSDDLSNGLDN